MNGLMLLISVLSFFLATPPEDVPAIPAGCKVDDKLGYVSYWDEPSTVDNWTKVSSYTMYAMDTNNDGDIDVYPICGFSYKADGVWTTHTWESPVPENTSRDMPWIKSETSESGVQLHRVGVEAWNLEWFVVYVPEDARYYREFQNGVDDDGNMKNSNDPPPIYLHKTFAPVAMNNWGSCQNGCILPPLPRP